MFRFYLILLLINSAGLCANAQVARIMPCFHPGTYSKNFIDVISVAGNPAILFAVKAFTAGAYGERKFLLDGLQSGLLSAAFPLMNGGVGVHLHHTGGVAYAQSEAGLAYAKDLGRAGIGVRFSYYNMTIQGYGQRGTLLIDIGSAWQLTENMYAGITLYNPFGGKLGTGGEKVAYSYMGGLGYEISDHVLLAADCIKTEDKPIDVRSAIQYEPSHGCLLQFGITTANAKPFMGVGLPWKRLRIYMNVSYHARLGFSPAFAIIYGKIKREKAL